ncbi:MAG: HEAT repeat domain-containing protein [Myxococcales bacterium]|nr:HEAT repeat domain-containing protein [Myxococcales bacterium]MDH3483495.1 HEAT repeat domain-containing protein [Myxococcales bacterium]
MRFDVRREDRRNLAVGFIGLLAIMAAHSVMETARDVLFLASLPATQLPWAYLAIALLAILELKIHERVLGRIRDRRTLLAVSLLAGSLVTLGFWALLEELGPWAPFGFYVWTGLLVTVVLIEFWLLLDDAVTVTQAKRIFPAIAAGGVTGAMLGSLVAETLLRVTDPPGLVVAAAIVLASAASTPFLWKVRTSGGTDPPFGDRERSVGWLLRDSYLSRLLLLVMIGTITLTVVDYVFKSTVASNIPPEGLGQFFARFYLGLNSVALIVQLVGAGWLLRGFGAHRSSALLPVLIMGGAMGLALGPVLLFAVALKAFDGSLRHTLYRSSVEVLYLPLDSRRRERAKGIIEVFGHRVGQAVASVLIMAAVGLGLTNRDFGFALLFVVAAWLATIMSTRRQYVEQFRSRLRSGVIDTRLELEELDLHSLEALLNALNSEQDEEVLAAIDIFSTHGREDLIPVLVLYHPSKEVRIRAFESFAEASDKRFVPVARRMLSDEDPDIQAAALRALTAVDPDRALLEEKLDLDASIVRATALVGLLSIEPETRASRLDEWIREGNTKMQHSLARAIRNERGDVFHNALIRLIESDDAEVKLETLHAMEGNPDLRYLPFLLPLLGSSDFREATRRAMVAIGPKALDYVDEALGHPSTPRKVRRRIPHTIIRFEPQRAASILLRHLELENEGAVRFKILQALARLQSTHPSTVLDIDLLRDQLRGHLLRVVTVLQWRASIENVSALELPDSELLQVALRDKERATLERSFWLMGLQYPEENFTLVWRGLRSDNLRLHAASVEVLEAALSGPFREAVLALVDEGEAPTRRASLAAAALGESIGPMSYDEAVNAMIEDQSEVIRGIAIHHAAELEKRTAKESLIIPEEIPGIA